MQLLVVLLNAVVGGVTVLTGLNPYIVAAHFLAAVLLLSATAISYDLAHRRVRVAAHLATVVWVTIGGSMRTALRCRIH